MSCLLRTTQLAAFALGAYVAVQIAWTLLSWLFHEWTVVFRLGPETDTETWAYYDTEA